MSEQSEYVNDFASYWGSLGLSVSNEGMKVHEDINGASGTTTAGRLGLKVAGPLLSSVFRSMDDEGFTARDMTAVAGGVALGAVAAPFTFTSLGAVALGFGAGLVGEFVGEKVYDELNKPGSDSLKAGNFKSRATTFVVDPETGKSLQFISQLTDAGPNQSRLKTWVSGDGSHRELINDILIPTPPRGELTETELQALYNATTLEQAFLNAGLINPELLLPGYYTQNAHWIAQKNFTTGSDGFENSPSQNWFESAVDGFMSSIFGPGTDGKYYPDNYSGPLTASGRVSWTDANGTQHWGSPKDFQRAADANDVQDGSASAVGSGSRVEHTALNDFFSAVDDFFGGSSDAISGGDGEDESAPILLDLTGAGIAITELSQSTVFMDALGDGLPNRTAWAAAGAANYLPRSPSVMCRRVQRPGRRCHRARPRLSPDQPRARPHDTAQSCRRNCPERRGECPAASP